MNDFIKFRAFILFIFLKNGCICCIRATRKVEVDAAVPHHSTGDDSVNSSSVSTQRMVINLTEDNNA